MAREIADLPIAVSLPDNDEIILPIIKDREGIPYGARKIIVSDLIDIIKSEVISGADIEVEITDRGIKFTKS